MASSFFCTFLLLSVFFILQGTNTYCASTNSSDLSKSEEVQVFFKLENIKIGHRIPAYFKVMSTKIIHFLPKEKADSMPFSSKQLPEILDLFSIPKNSTQAKKVAVAIRACERDPAPREIKFCADSIESLNKQVRDILGSDAHINVLTTKLSPNHKTNYQNYTVLGEPKKVDTHKQLGCHLLPYPYKIYFCHTQTRDHMIYKFPMVGDDGERIEAVGACHSDTANFNPEHVAFKVLKTKPGADVCHFMQAIDFFFVATPTGV